MSSTLSSAQADASVVSACVTPGGERIPGTKAPRLAPQVIRSSLVVDTQIVARFWHCVKVPAHPLVVAYTCMLLLHAAQ